ncbi:MAG: Thioredoxin-disulfide reductase [Thermodesulfobacterium sp. 37_54]|uniref:Thioredoxin reductase n=1 Tax=Thermodesulfobacterium commune TaxID=1741 RepID=A0A124FKN1_9BACT|nr:MAG: Thioredoxin-disulfide reductase [Thermodesulfobacterium sp. 37_54]KUK19531.1 MAG: Thioredoxin-disulfide reductase [Thermodesulfobacterium commune]KUK37734.1 MAG: Thioredoxin-disulfide reductase [Thermodesulfobacterium commune]HAA84127.1 thioredoxin reductase [Thermodesulfobacterium commune]HBT04043.1 thioredoxin reductase [Thermodesulfobacterium commune]
MKINYDYEIAIIGIGPAGIQAGLHAGRRKHKVVLLGKLEESALWSAHIENYFGFSEKVDGKVLLEEGLKAVKKFGGELILEDVISIEPLELGFKLITEKEREITSLSLILAMGVKRKKRVFQQEEKFVGKGVSYCADCDAWFYKGKKVMVIGDGSAAIHGAKTLKKFADKVYFYGLKPISEESLSELRVANIEVLEKKPVEIMGDNEVKGVMFDDGTQLELDGIFIEIGAKGPIELLAPIGIELDPETFSYVKVDRKMQTNVQGVFACGDLTGSPLQLAKAVGEGCVAGLSASDYVKQVLKNLKEG